MELTTLQRKAVVANPQGMHMRPCAAFVETARRYQSTVRVRNGDGPAVDGKSIMDLFSLIAECGNELTLEADGPDAAEALDALAELVRQVPPPD